MKRWKDLMALKYTPAQLAKRRAQVEAEIEQINLKVLREAAGKTQGEAVCPAEMDQAEEEEEVSATIDDIDRQ